MTVGIAHNKIYLIDHWPGEVTHGPNPSDWTAVSATEDVPLGTKRMIYDDTHNGWATLMYLKFVDGAVPEPTVRMPCGVHTASAASGYWQRVNNDGSEVNLTGPIAIALGSPTTATPYGWFWVGGVCPSDTIATLDDGLYWTDGSVTAQSYMVLAASASYAKFHLATATDVANFSAFSMAEDTTS